MGGKITGIDDGVCAAACLASVIYVVRLLGGGGLTLGICFALRLLSICMLCVGVCVCVYVVSKVSVVSEMWGGPTTLLRAKAVL